MNAIILGLLGLAAAYAVLRWFVNASPSKLLTSGRTIIFVLGLAITAVLALTGRIGLAIPLATILFYLHGRGVFGKPKLGARRAGNGTPKSMVRTAALEMELDHQTGAMKGRVLAGSFEGRDLDTLDVAALGRLASEIAGDQESRSLLEVYLDRRMPRWREYVKADAATGQRRAPHSGAMSEEEAYQILGLEKGAREPEIRAAHRRLMKKVHPDSGGSTFLAARINEAKDRLLSKHR
jgi:hypothetical protein